MHRLPALEVFVLFFEKPKDIFMDFSYSGSQFLNHYTLIGLIIDHFIVSSVCKRPKPACSVSHMNHCFHLLGGELAGSKRGEEKKSDKDKQSYSTIGRKLH
jgi:hypothetical protein